MKKARLIKLKPIDAIKETLVRQGFSQPVKDYKEANQCWYEGEIYL